MSLDLHFWPTPNGKKVTILLEEANIPYNVVKCNIGRGDRAFGRCLTRQPLCGHTVEMLVENAPPPPQLGVDGAFKIPGLRNVELTGPFFHNGGQATLQQVIEFYARIGDFAEAHPRPPDTIERPGPMLGLRICRTFNLLARGLPTQQEPQDIRLAQRPGFPAASRGVTLEKIVGISGPCSVPLNHLLRCVKLAPEYFAAYNPAAL